MNKKPIVLTFNKFYLPGYRAGGPIRTLSNMVERLGNEIDFRIITLDRDAGTNEPFDNISHCDWNKVGHARVLYLNPENISLHSLVKIFKDVQPDVIYLNSFFDNIFTQRILWARRLGQLGKVPVILAPRGEFSSGALGLKWLKKKIYLRITKTIKLYSKLIWHVSSEKEQEDLLCSLSFVCSDDIRIAMNLAPSSELHQIKRKIRNNGEPLRVCFLSRVSRMKNLDFALKVMMKVSVPIVFSIYGPKSDAIYWNECEALISILPDNIKVVYEGIVHPSTVKEKLAQHDLFFLPTRGENYGHVIHEALTAGLPVLISDQTPWNEVTKHKVGWACPLDAIDTFVRIIESVYGWSLDKHEETARLASSYAHEKTIDSNVIVQNKAIFISAINS